MIVKKPMLVEDHQSEIKSPERPQEPLQKSRCLTTARMPFSEMIWDVTVTLGGWLFFACEILRRAITEQCAELPLSLLVAAIFVQEPCLTPAS